MNRPFDAARYAGLLEGLEATEVDWSKLERTKRIDSEYFLKRHLRNQATLSRHDLQSVADCAMVADGNHFAISDEFVEDGVPYYRGQDVSGQFFVEHASPIGISRKAFDAQFMKRSHLCQGDVLLSIIGTIGESSLVSSKRDATCSCKLAILRSRKIIPAYLAAYLRCEYGHSQTSRLTRGAVQMGLLLEDMDQLMLPLASENFQRAIETSITAARDAYDAAAAALTDAEGVLLAALGLADWQPPQPLSYVRNSRDAFAAGRLDAEYFAPRVVELLGRLNQHGQRIRDVAPARHERFVASATGSFDYIEIGNLRADGTVTAESVEQSEAPSRATWRVHTNDVITSTVRPIRRLSALITPEQDGNVCSSGFVVLEPKAVPPEVLLAYLRLPPVCELMDLHTSASLYPAIAEADLLALPFPRLDADTQARVVANVRTAQASRQRAADLLDTAKRAVEIAIEDSEAAALTYLQKAHDGNA